MLRNIMNIWPNSIRRGKSLTKFVSDIYRKSFTFPGLSHFPVTLASTSSTKHAKTGPGQVQGNHQEIQHEFDANVDFSLPFASAKIGSFFQPQPVLHNQYLEDVTLQSYLKRHMPEEVFEEVSQDLEQFGHRVANDIYQLHLECDRQLPSLKHYDAWGTRIDEIVTCPAWKAQKRVAAMEGLIAIAYEKKHGEWSRLHQIAKLYLHSPSSGLYWCPLAMTDGAAKTLSVMQPGGRCDEALECLLSRNPDTFWTSGQWMTERKGGSDVANGTETYAVPELGGTYKLYGYKWFTSATDSDMTLTLARTVHPDGTVTPGTKGLSLFYLEVREDDGKLNNIQVQRLKDKLGTRQVPTAELLLDGTKAYKLSDDGRGVASISHMLIITRIHNTLTSAAGMRRITNLARDYSTKREAFGKIIQDYPLHIKVLSRMEVETRAATLFTLEQGRLLGRHDCGIATEHEQLLFRLLTPLAKLYTAKQAIAVASEGLECFGGQGYMEDTGLPVHLRDAQVLSIWEGTTNILSMDVLCSMQKSEGKVLKAFHDEILLRTEAALSRSELKPAADKLCSAAEYTITFAVKNSNYLEIAARDFAYSLARVYMGSLLVDHACWEGATQQDVFTAQRWCQQDLVLLQQQLELGNYSSDVASAEFRLVMDGYQGNINKL